MDAETRAYDAYADAYLKRADAADAEREQRCGELRARAKSMAEAVHARYGDAVRVVLFGSLAGKDSTALSPDIDLASSGLSPSEYWQAWALVEPLAGDAPLDFVRLETAPQSLREVIETEGEVLE